MEEDCMICALPLAVIYCEKLPCSHTFHYECLLKTIICGKRQTYNHTNRCPYCREKIGYLPVINGMTKPLKNIHYGVGMNPPDFPQIRCQHILLRGKNTGSNCDKKCQLGYTFCKNHNKILKI